MIVAVEGIDGAGKNTLVTALVELFRAEVISFPRYEESIHAQLAREALYGRMGDLTDSAYAMATLFALDRHGAKEHIEAFAGPKNPRLLLLDRYVASNAAYTAARLGDESAADWVAELEFGRLGLPVPDLQVLLDTPVELASERAAQRADADNTRAKDAYEKDGQLQRETSRMYSLLAERGFGSPWKTVGPHAPREEVAREIARDLGIMAR